MPGSEVGSLSFEPASLIRSVWEKKTVSRLIKNKNTWWKTRKDTDF